MPNISTKYFFILSLLLCMAACRQPAPYDLQPSDYFISRDALIEIANQWLDGKGPIAQNARQTINGVQSAIVHPEPGLTNRSYFCDSRKGQISVWAHHGHRLYQVRLAVRNGQLTEIEVFDVYGISRDIASLAGNFISRDELIKTVTIYFDALVHDGLSVPFDQDVVRYEMGIPLCVSSKICNAEHVFFGYLFRDVTDRRYVVDEKHGVIVAYISFELLGGIGGMTAVEVFSIKNDIIYKIHALWKYHWGDIDPEWNGGEIITPFPFHAIK